MENAILLNNLSPAELEEIIKKAVKNQLEEFKKKTVQLVIVMNY